MKKTELLDFPYRARDPLALRKWYAELFEGQFLIHPVICTRDRDLENQPPGGDVRLVALVLAMGCGVGWELRRVAQNRTAAHAARFAASWTRAAFHGAAGDIRKEA